MSLNPNRLVNVDVILAPNAVGIAPVNTLLILTDNAAIDTDTRKMEFNDIAGVSAAFGTAAVAYLAAVPYFSQSPQPDKLYVGRWAKAASAGINIGGTLTSSEQTITNFQVTGALTISIDGTPQSFTGLDLTTVTSLSQVASLVDAQLTTASCTWNASTGKFTITSNTTGATSSVGYATSGNLATLMKLTVATGGRLVTGIAAESITDALTIFDNLFGDSWYAVSSAETLTDNEVLQAAAYIEAGGRHVFGYTTQDTDVADSAITNDIASQLKTLLYTRTVGQYSLSSPYAINAALGKMLTVDFNAANSASTLMFKVETGVVAENLTATQASTLQSKNVNVFTSYTNGASIVQYGGMASGEYFDTIHGLDWLSRAIQAAGFNVLYTTPTKIPQTDAGMNQIATAFHAVLDQARINGLIAPGIWRQAGFGKLQQGGYLQGGYYIFIPAVQDQLQADREARKSVAFQIAVLLAGAVHTVSVIINVSK